MKSKLITILITSLIMIAGLGVFLWKMNDISREQAKKEAALLKEERDLVEEQDGKAIDNTKQVDIEPLHLSGDQKNVVTFNYGNVSEIYNPAKSAATEKTLTDIKKNKEFSFHDPLWSYNPYGTNSASMYVYFKSEGKCYCRYTVSVKSDQIPDFTRTLQGSAAGELTKEHEYQIPGLVQGMTNYIVLRLYNGDDELSDVMTWQVDIPASPSGAEIQIQKEAGRSKTAISNGLYTVFMDGKQGSDGREHNMILQYDNSGILRTEIPLNGYVGRNMQTVYDNLVYECAENQVTKINALGQVMDTYTVNGYRLSGEYAYDGAGSLYLIATALGKNVTKNSKILKLELVSGEASVALDLDTLLPAVKKNAAKQSKSAERNWIDLDSVQVAGTNQLVLSSRTLSSIFKVSNVSSLLPKVNYIIADQKLWSRYNNLKKKVLTKALPEGEEQEPTEEPVVKSILEPKKAAPELFRSQYGQDALYRTTGSLGEGQYYLEMLNNNAGVGAGNTGNSYYYRYLVDETAGTYILDDSRKLDKNTCNGNVTVTGKVIVYCDSDSRRIVETDDSGKLIRQFQTNRNIYRVYKNDWKGFWFR